MTAAERDQVARTWWIATVRAAAQALGVYPISINWWLSVNGYEVIKTAKVIKAKPEASQS